MQRVTLAWWMAAVLGAPACAAGGAPVCMAGDHLDGRGRCTRETPVHRMPFRQGFETRVTQGFHGVHSHANGQPYALDFLCEEGDPVVATRAGVVWDKREDSLGGCADVSCDGDANFVVLDHGDGTFTEYHHLAPMGVTVELGQQVCRGQVIGVCGATGYTTGAHLHWALMDRAHRTIPARLVEARERDPIGYPLPGVRYTSQNERQLSCPEIAPSTLAPDAFAHQGVLLREPMDRVLQRGQTRRQLAGRYYGSATHIALGRRLIGREEAPWIMQCAPVREDGSFEMMVDWEAALYPEGVYWVMFSGMDAPCEGPEWAWSYKVRLQGAPATRHPVVASPPDRSLPRVP